MFTYNIKFFRSNWAEGLEETLIGSARVIIIYTSEGPNLFETCDAESQELYELYAAVCSHKTDSVKDGIYDMTLSPHIMYISSIELLPEYRGQNLGGILARFVAHVLGAGYSVFLKPYPLNCYDLDKGRVDKIVDKLRRSYRRAGFESIRKSGYMLLPKCRAVLLP